MYEFVCLKLWDEALFFTPPPQLSEGWWGRRGEHQPKMTEVRSLLCPSGGRAIGSLCTAPNPVDTSVLQASLLGAPVTQPVQNLLLPVVPARKLEVILGFLHSPNSSVCSVFLRNFFESEHLSPSLLPLSESNPTPTPVSCAWPSPVQPPTHLPSVFTPAPMQSIPQPTTERTF